MCGIAGIYSGIFDLLVEQINLVFEENKLEGTELIKWMAAIDEVCK